MKTKPLLPLISWAFYDWGNSAFSAIIQTFVFAAYFTKHVATDETTGSGQWGLMNGIAALVIILCGPIFGAIADHGKRKKLWVAFFTYLCIISTSLLWFVTPDASHVIYGLWMCCIGIIASELAFVFYNALLPVIAPPESIGKWSGWGWGFGYAGGTLSLVVALALFVGEHPFIPLETSQASHIRATFVLTGLWFLLFSLPLFIFVPQQKGKEKPIKAAVQEGFLQLINTFKNIRSYLTIVKFLIARIFFIEGLTTLFAFGGVFAVTLFSMNAKEVLIFGIVLNCTAGLGAFGLAWLDDRIGPKNLILLSIAGVMLPLALLLFTTDKMMFWILGSILGIFVGPVQSASRSLMAHLAPLHLRNEMFGFFAFSGKATSFISPILIGSIIYTTGSQRAGMSIILAFLLIGFLLMLRLPKMDSMDKQ